MFTNEHDRGMVPPVGVCKIAEKSPDITLLPYAVMFTCPVEASNTSPVLVFHPRRV